MMDILRVSTTTDLAATAGAIAHGITVDGAAEIQVIGPRAVNQAVKAIARGYVAASGIDVYCIPSFATVHVGAEDTEEEMTGIRFQICPRHDVRRQAEPPVHN